MNMMKLTSNWPIHWIDDYDETDLELTHPSQVRTARVRSGWEMQEGQRPTANSLWSWCQLTIYPNDDENDNLSKWCRWQFIRPTNQCIPLHCIAIMWILTSDQTNEVDDDNLSNDVDVDKWSDQWCLWQRRGASRWWRRPSQFPKSSLLLSLLKSCP